MGRVSAHHGVRCLSLYLETFNLMSEVLFVVYCIASMSSLLPNDGKNAAKTLSSFTHTQFAG